MIQPYQIISKIEIARTIQLQLFTLHCLIKYIRNIQSSGSRRQFAIAIQLWHSIAFFGLAVGYTGQARFGVSSSQIALGRKARFGVSSRLHWEGSIRRQQQVARGMGRLDSALAVGCTGTRGQGYRVCHATDGPPKIGPPGTSMNGCHTQMVSPDHLWRRRWSPLNYPYRNDVCKDTTGRATNNHYYSLIAMQCLTRPLALLKQHGMAVCYVAILESQV